MRQCNIFCKETFGINKAVRPWCEPVVFLISRTLFPHEFIRDSLV